MTAPPDAPTPARPACPRCGARLGRIAAGAPAPSDDWFCGCCGLVVPGAAGAAR